MQADAALAPTGAAKLQPYRYRPAWTWNSTDVSTLEACEQELLSSLRLVRECAFSSMISSVETLYRSIRETRGPEKLSWIHFILKIDLPQLVIWELGAGRCCQVYMLMVYLASLHSYCSFR